MKIIMLAQTYDYIYSPKDAPKCYKNVVKARRRRGNQKNRTLTHIITTTHRTHTY